MLEGDHTPYNKTWLYAKPDAEKKLRALLKQLGGNLDGTAPMNVAIPSSVNANGAPTAPALPDLADAVTWWLIAIGLPAGIIGGWFLWRRRVS